MKLYDVTRPIHSGMAVYAGDPAVTLRRALSIAAGAPVNVSAVSLGSHTGTHVDAPAHLRDGAPGVDALPLDLLIGPARLYALDTGGTIDVADLDGLDLGSCPRALFKTRPPLSAEAGGLTAAAARSWCGPVFDWSGWRASRSMRLAPPTSPRIAPCSTPGRSSWRGWICPRCRREDTRSSVFP